MSNEHITDEQIERLLLELLNEPDRTLEQRPDRYRRVRAAYDALALRPAAQPSRLAGNWFCGNCRVPVPAPLSAAPAQQPSQTWDANQIAMACAQAEISDSLCQSLLIALEESNKD